jgi:outer membrane receptor protein involved in Fe transport
MVDQLSPHLGSGPIKFFAGGRSGWFSGAFNSRAPAGAPPLPFDFFINPPAKPEKATAFEIGAKTDWLDNRVRANIAAFWNKYSDLQVAYFVPLPGTPRVLANGANERARGVELELAVTPVDNLTLTGSIGYLDARYTSFDANLGNQDYKPIICDNVTVDHAQSGPCYLVPYRAPLLTMRYQIGYNYPLPHKLGLLTPWLSFGVETTN